MIFNLATKYHHTHFYQTNIKPKQFAIRKGLSPHNILRPV